VSSSSSIQVLSAAQRFRTQTQWIQSRHSFSFGPHYDPANVGFGPLIVLNEETVAPNQGFDTHPHRDQEIVTWVLRGSLVHQDSHGNNGVVHPGLAQRMSAGHGIMHSERNDTWREDVNNPPEPVRFIQMWVLPDELSSEPGYEQRDIRDQLTDNDWTVVASGLPEHADITAIRIHQKRAGFLVANLSEHSRLQTPDAPLLYLHVAHGQVQLADGSTLNQGDGARLLDVGGIEITSGPTDTQVLLWQMNS